MTKTLDISGTEFIDGVTSFNVLSLLNLLEASGNNLNDVIKITVPTPVFVTLLLNNLVEIEDHNGGYYSFTINNGIIPIHLDTAQETHAQVCTTEVQLKCGKILDLITREPPR